MTVLFTICNKSSVAQSNLIKKVIASQKDTVLIDSVSIAPNTFLIQNIEATTYQIDYINAKLIWLQKPKQDSVLVHYRILPFKLNNTLYAYDYDSLHKILLVSPYQTKKNEELGNGKLFDFGTMEYAGSFGRGISFGNAQDAVLNSNLNLQLNGMLPDSIEIAASLSDQNLPIQPDGSTTQLNEIDKIFIQLKKKNWNLNLGDIDLRQNNHYYLNFYKRIQGFSYETSNAISKKITNNLIASGAIAKGKFNSNTFQGLEGNQGPYRLKGANNEFFFIVLGGTERVYLDGELLQRGEDQDYIINYNTAEITFTPNILITKDKRIRVEFEYSDRNYVNSQLFASNEIVINNKLKIALSAFSNTDAKNSPINQTLNAAQKSFLGNIGDDVQNAFYPTAIKDTLEPGKILYKQVDTIVNNILQQIYVYSSSPDSAIYNLSFAEIGSGKGNYVILLNGANGKVFKWVKPIGAIKQGDYEPVQYLVAARKQQIYNLQTQYQYNKNSSLDWEVAMSNNDVNTFSNKDKKNDKGTATKLKWNNTKYKSNNAKLETSAAYEINNANFRALERLRNPEFNRDWNLPFTTNLYAEQLGYFSTKWSTKKNNFINLQIQNYFKENGYKGYRQSFSTKHNIKGWQLNTVTNITNTLDSFQKGFFLRPSVDIAKNFTKLNNYKFGVNYFSEKNTLLLQQPDTFNLASFAFESYKIYLKSDDTKLNKWGLSYIIRNNRIPIGKKLLLSDQAQDVEGNLLLTKNPNHLLTVKATYRQLHVAQPTKVTYKSDKTLLGRIEYNITEWNGLLQGNALYETGTGQEQKRDFAYLQVPTGQGEYYWQDYNNDGVQQLNEFEFAQFPDQRKFIKIYVPTNQFIKANFNNFNYSVALNPKAKYTKSNYKGFLNFISKTYLQSAIQIQKKEQSNNLLNYNAFKYSVQDTSLILLNRIFSNSFSYNKFSTDWGIDFNQNFRVNKALLTYGYESREAKMYMLKGRINIKNKILWETIAKTGINSLATPAFNNRNYDITEKSLENKINFIRKTNFRLIATYILEKKQNSIVYGAENAQLNSIALESKFNLLQSTSLLGKFTFSNIKYKGTANNTISYIMLDALVPGKNYLWNVEFIKMLKNNLEISFRYDGRKTGSSKPVHIGSATMRATFY